MNDKYVYRDFNSYCTQFQQGIKHLDKGQHEQALYCFQLAYESVKTREPLHNKYASFCGLLRTMQGDYGGLILCQDAARSENYDGDVFLNLARAEYWMNNRKRAVEAIQRGLVLEPNYPGLHRLQREMGVRRRNPVPLLRRENRVNVTIGRLLRRVKSME